MNCRNKSRSPLHRPPPPTWRPPSGCRCRSRRVTSRAAVGTLSLSPSLQPLSAVPVRSLTPVALGCRGRGRPVADSRCLPRSLQPAAVGASGRPVTSGFQLRVVHAPSIKPATQSVPQSVIATTVTAPVAAVRPFAAPIATPAPPVSVPAPLLATSVPVAQPPPPPLQQQFAKTASTGSAASASVPYAASQVIPMAGDSDMDVSDQGDNGDGDDVELRVPSRVRHIVGATLASAPRKSGWSRSPYPDFDATVGPIARDY